MIVYHTSETNFWSDRKGYRLMWSGCKHYLQGIAKILPPGHYPKTNQHGGVMPATPKECDAFTNKRVATIMRRCAESGKLTRHDVFKLRKCFAFIWQTQGKGGTNDNFPCMPNVIASINAETLKRKVRVNTPMKKPTAEQIKSAFTKGWTKKTGMPFLRWCQCLMAGYDQFFNGHRPKSDTSRVKINSENLAEAEHRHVMSAEEGWCSSGFQGGRSKLTGMRKGRPWRAYRVCHCVGAKHVSPPEEALEFDLEGNPKSIPTWFTECPVACYEVIMKTQGHLLDTKKGLYKTWSTTRGCWNERNHGDVAAMAFEFLKIQGVEGEFDPHCGRKTYGALCDHLRPQIPYQTSFQVHGDLAETWSNAYQFGMRRSNYSVREQSRDPTMCCKSGRLLAQWLGRGKEAKADLDPTQAMLLMIAQRMGIGDQADNLLYGPKKEKRKREDDKLPKRQLFPKKPKKESDDEDEG